VATENSKYNPCHFPRFESVVRFGGVFPSCQAAIVLRADSIARELTGPNLDRA
jgi:hypothetical protein